MKKLKISLLFIICLFVLTGCNKAKSEDSELKILGVNTENVDKIEIIHGKIILYPDLEQNDNLTLIEDLNTALENTDDKIETLDENLEIALADAEGYAQKKEENYYVYIVFLNQQTISFKNNNEVYQNCDGALYDINNMKLNLSKDGKFIGTMSYASKTISDERDFSTLKKEIENIFIDLND